MREETINQMIEAGSAGILARCLLIQSNSAIGYGAWSTGNIMEEMVQEHLEHHRDPGNCESNNIILEQDF